MQYFLFLISQTFLITNTMTDVEKRGPEWGDTDGSGSDTNSGMSSAFTDTTRKTLTNKLTNQLLPFHMHREHYCQYQQ